MVTPKGEEIARRVQVARDRTGKVVGFQDPDRGYRFISRADALPRLRYSIEKSRIEDTFGNRVGVGSLGLPGRGLSVAFKVKEATYRPLQVSPQDFQPRPNQEVIERTVFITREGKLVSSETSYGLGEAYDPAKTGGRWRRAASKAVGAKEGERLLTSDLARAVAHQEFLVKSISG